VEERSVTRRTALPLVVVAATFFLPMVDSCERAISPLSYVAEGPWQALWVLPTFAAAFVLATAVFRSWRSKAKTAIAFAAMGAFALTLPFHGVAFGVSGALVPAIMYGVATLGTVLLLGRARAKTGWQRLSSLLDAYAVAAAPLAVTIATIGKYAGAYAFVVAYVAFATQRGLVAIQSAIDRRRRAVNADGTRVRIGASEPRARIGEHEEALDEEVEAHDVRTSC
jgi:hypothetical protein